MFPVLPMFVPQVPSVDAPKNEAGNDDAIQLSVSKGCVRELGIRTR